MRRIAIAIALLLIPGAGAADATMPSAGVLLQGWSGGQPSTQADLTPVPFDSAATARHREVAAGLAKAVATDDAKAFRSLHSDAGWAQTDDWWKAMLANQKKGFGRIVRALGPVRGSIGMGTTGLGVPPNGAAVLIHFERAGASMSFELDESGRIAKSSLWVQRELATVHPEGAEVLWEAKKKGARR